MFWAVFASFAGYCEKKERAYTEVQALYVSAVKGLLEDVTDAYVEVACVGLGGNFNKIEGISGADGNVTVVKFGTYLPSCLEYIPYFIAHFLFVVEVYMSVFFAVAGYLL